MFVADLTEQRTLTLPAVGSVNSFWDFNVGSQASRRDWQGVLLGRARSSDANQNPATKQED